MVQTMTFARRIIPLLALLVGACDTPPGSEPLTLSLIGDAPASLKRALTQGLVSFAPDGNVEPALAERWIITDGGLSYIFRIRDSVWSNGKPVRAPDVAAILKRAVAASPGLFSSVDSIVPMTGRIIEIRLKQPQPEFLSLMALPELGIGLKGSGTGPYFVHSRKNEVTRLRLIERKNLVAQPDEPADAKDVRVRTEAAPLAIARYASGGSAYVAGGTAANLPYALAARLPADQLKVEAVRGLFGLAVTRADGPLKNRNLRLALSLALDRSAMTARFGGIDWPEATTTLPDQAGSGPAPATLEGFELSFQERLAKARTLAGKDAKTVRIFLPQGPGMRVMLASLATNWRPLNVTVVAASRRDMSDLYLIDEVAPIASPYWYIDRLGCKQMSPCEEGTDALLRRALATETTDDRNALFRQADSAIASAQYFIPIARPLRWSLVRGTVSGWKASPIALHPWHRLALTAR